MLLSCVFIGNSALEDGGVASAQELDQYAVTCYICVNVSDNVVCNQFAIDRPCQPGNGAYRPVKTRVTADVAGETFCHTLHIMDARGGSVLVNKKCTDDQECQRNRVGCVKIDAQTVRLELVLEVAAIGEWGFQMCISCCDRNYCNAQVPVNSSTAVFDDQISRMRLNAKNLFRERGKALTTSVRPSRGAWPSGRSLWQASVALWWALH